MGRLIKVITHPIFVIFGILLADQIFKIWVKTHMYLGEEIHILGNWFIIHFTENNGMAFGFQFGGDWGKLILSSFRIVAIGALIWYVIKLLKINAPKGVVICMSLILAGAIGNVIDSLFYGLIFTESYQSLATIFPEGGGYAPFLFGKVVDMLYFPLMEGFLPNWVPIWGGEYFIFFRPVFNIADSSITVGVISLILFYRNFFKEEDAPLTSEPELN